LKYLWNVTVMFTHGMKERKYWKRKDKKMKNQNHRCHHLRGHKEEENKTRKKGNKENKPLNYNDDQTCNVICAHRLRTVALSTNSLVVFREITSIMHDI
jgi:hypothetical protein